jgi:hypothetical protein
MRYIPTKEQIAYLQRIGVPAFANALPDAIMRSMCPKPQPAKLPPVSLDPPFKGVSVPSVPVHRKAGLFATLVGWWHDFLAGRF